MLSVEMWSGHEAQEELRSICVWSCISHREVSPCCVLFLEVLVVEFCTVDTFTASSIPSCEVSTLCHETLDDSVEVTSFEV